MLLFKQCGLIATEHNNYGSFRKGRIFIYPIVMNNFHLMKQQQSKHCLNKVSLLAQVEFSENYECKSGSGYCKTFATKSFLRLSRTYIFKQNKNLSNI